MEDAHLPSIAITGIGMVTSLGERADEVLRRIRAEDTSAVRPTGFAPGLFDCPVCARVQGFEPQRYASEAKLVRLMSREAQLAVAAARLALQDAGVTAGTTYPPEEMGLFGATGMAGLPLAEVVPLIRASAGPDGGFDYSRFGRAGLKAVSPMLSFKILANMPLCFVSINENIQGPNAVYAPWEGQGAQAIEAGVRAIRAGDAQCALVGGCDAKTHELAFAGLEQQGLFESWRQLGHTAALPPDREPSPARSTLEQTQRTEQVRRSPDMRSRCEPGTARGPNGIVPGEGAAFLVLESPESAKARGAHVYARIASYGLRTRCKGREKSVAWSEALGRLGIAGEVGAIVSAANGDADGAHEEQRSLKEAGIAASVTISPKKHVGDLFAAAGVLQVALAAVLSEQCGKAVVANCFGHGSEQAAFALEPS